VASSRERQRGGFLVNPSMDPTLEQIIEDRMKWKLIAKQVAAENEQLKTRVAELEAASEPTPISKAQEA
jgi:hypothetical protein